MRAGHTISATQARINPPAFEQVDVLSFGIVEGEPVFMDAASDTYFSLDAPGRARLCALLVQRHPVTDDPVLRNALGIVDEPTRIVQTICLPPTNSLLDKQSQSAGLLDIVRVTRLIWSTRALLRRWTIGRILRAVCKGIPGGYGETDPAQRARRFLSARPYTAASGTCLSDSLALLRWLGKHASKTDLIFGVKLNPFAAHCWVQSGDLLLNDRLENVAAFTPVRVISCSDPML